MWMVVASCALLAAVSYTLLTTRLGHRGGWFYAKKYLFYVLMRWRKYCRKHPLHGGKPAVDLSGEQFSLMWPAEVQQMEMAQPLDEMAPTAVDSMYFNGFHRDGTSIFMRVDRTRGGRAAVWLSVSVPALGAHTYSAHVDVWQTARQTFSAGGMSLECDTPMSRWKLSYIGLLRRDQDNETLLSDVETVHMQIAFTWMELTQVFNFDAEVDYGQIAAAVAREPWTREFFKRLQKLNGQHYEQWGGLRGSIEVDGFAKQTLRLRGLRNHKYGECNWSEFRRSVTHTGYDEDGNNFHVSSISMTKTLSLLHCGYVSSPTAYMAPVTWTDVNLAELGEDKNPPDHYIIKFKADGKLFDVEVQVTSTSVFYLGENEDVVVLHRTCRYQVNGVDGYGIAEFSYRHSSGSVNVRLPPSSSTQPVSLIQPLAVGSPLLEQRPVVADPVPGQALVVALEGASCVEWTGGKASQLALLMKLNSKQFSIPNGICLTFSAFKLHLELNIDLEHKVRELEAIASGRLAGDLRTACDSTVNLFMATPLCASIKQALLAELSRAFPTDHQGQCKFAVRSSAAGEDGRDLSSAGQLDTVLGVERGEKMLSAVQKCWSSLFAFPPVEYRRQYGQPIYSMMAVIIQEMVPSEAAGVVFMCNPLTGDPRQVSINSSYGLGQAVVSGEVQPDLITLSRSGCDTITIESRQLGDKKYRIDMSDDGTMDKVAVAESDATRCSVGDDVIKRLAKIGIELESRWFDAGDIEWAVKDDVIYLLQARPITTSIRESDTEMMHEFDSPLAHDREMMTTANATEAMPLACTMLTLSIHMPINYAYQIATRMAGMKTQLHSRLKAFGRCCGIGLLNVTYMQSRTKSQCLNGDKRMMELSVFGKVINALTQSEIDLYHGRSTFWGRLLHCLRQFKTISQAGKGLAAWNELLKHYGIADEASALRQHEAISRAGPNMAQMWTCHMLNSMGSSMWNIVLFNIIASDVSEYTTQHFSDVAQLLSNCEHVISADVPFDLEALVNAIRADGHTDKLLAMTTQEATDWLQSGESGRIGDLLEQFLVKHGHRCVRELEMLEKSWRADPVKLVQAIQVMLRCQKPAVVKTPQKDDIAETIAGINSPTTWTQRLMMRWLVPKARRAVAHREFSKSLSVKMCDVTKSACWRLAKLLVEEGRLPDEELTFFFQFHEIDILLRDRTNAPKLIRLARDRRRIWPKQCKVTLPLIAFGSPVPIPAVVVTGEQRTASLTMKGMPVCLGVVEAIARVVNTLEEASSIEEGEILIVPFTDIGWSPYFPVIAGLVTEIGGLLSHGAVIAREYGLPCIVSVTQATSLFKTGDRVLLNATEGSIQRIMINE